jgi:uncharacterized DUF497 family protein
MVATIFGEEFEGDTEIEVVRIITARRATAKERRDYEIKNG